MNGENEILVRSIYYPDGVTVEKSKIIEFVKPILGFNSYKKFCILNINKEENIPFFILQSIEDEKLCFIIADPNFFFKDYSIPILEEEKEILCLSAKEKAIIFVIMTACPDLYLSTVNLKGPIIINTKNNKAIQTVLNNDMYSAKQKLPIVKNSSDSRSDLQRVSKLTDSIGVENKNKSDML
ncbi:MAG TPA: flagellar assembly protein FliW [bacterium]|nr:flagellar assembly protein FliW [bacterium]